MWKRRISQVTALLVLHSSWGPEVKWLCNPVLSCHSCALAWFACPIGVFSHYAGYHLFPFLAVGTVLLVGALVGRLFCGWVCPFGFLMDLLYKIPSPKSDLPHWTGYLKYGVLGVTVVALPFVFGESTLWSFCRVCPASALQVTIPGMVTGGLASMSPTGWVKLGVLAAVVALAVTSSRSFCKVLCPIGAIMAPLNYVSFWAVRMPAVRPCTGCKLCDKKCPVDGSPFSRVGKGKAVNRAAECIVCHDCSHSCPSNKTPQAGGGA